MYNLSQNIKFKFEYIYLIGLILAVFSFTLNITELSETQTAINSIVNILKYIGIGLILLKSLFFTKYKKASPIFWILLLLLLFIIYIHTHNNNLIFIALLSLGAVNVDTKLILKSHIIAQILAIIFTFFLVRHNVIMNLIYYRNNKMRPSFGFVYPTALSAVLFSIVISYVVLKKFTLNIWEYFLIICLIYFTLFVLDARLDGYLMIMIIVSVFLYKKIINVISKLKKSICLVISLFFITLSFLLSYFFNDSSSFFSNLDNIFNNRLSQSHIALTQYPLSLLGQNIQMQGLGGQQGLHQNFTYYFYIDNSFIQILIIDGLILFLIVLFLIITFFIKWHQQRMYILELALLFVCIAAMVEDSLVSAASSIIFIIMMANNDGYKNYIEDNYHEYTTKNEKSSFINKTYKTYVKHTRLTSKYKIFGNIKNSENLVVVLAGYKAFLWDEVFYRLNKFLPQDNKFEVCIVSSGVYSDELKRIAEKYNWVYMSVKRNNVCLAQNTAINAFPAAKYIYKIDEDMFLTKGFFEELKNTYLQVNEKTHYTCGFVAPLIPINGVGHVEILKKYNKIKDFENRFHEKVKYSASPSRENSKKNPEVAEYFWGKDSQLPSIDEMNKDFKANEVAFKISPNLFSIGAILFRRDFWQKMNMFPVSLVGTDMGLDEYRMNAQAFCDFNSVVIAMRSVVGHFSYGPQTQVMKKYYTDNLEKFNIK